MVSSWVLASSTVSEICWSAWVRKLWICWLVERMFEVRLSSALTTLLPSELFCGVEANEDRSVCSVASCDEMSLPPVEDWPICPIACCRFW